MGRTVLLLSLVGTAILFTIGLVDPNSPVMWEASTTGAFAILRLIMMLALAALLATHPPRNLYLRMLVGLLVVGFAAWGINSTYNYHMKLLDTLSILQFSVSAGLAVLELEDEPVPAESAKVRVKPAH